MNMPKTKIIMNLLYQLFFEQNYRTHFFTCLANLIPNLPILSNLRTKFVKLAGAKIGKKCEISKGIDVGYGPASNIEMKNKCFLNTNVRFDCSAKIRLGNNVLVGSQVKFETANHLWKNGERKGIHGDIIIGDNVWIGTGAIICPDIKVGDNVTIGAGAVVTKNVPNNTLVGGVPARIIKKYVL